MMPEKDFIAKKFSYVSLSVFKIVLVPILMGISLINLYGFKAPYQKAKLKKIIIDAGHGGHDVGALGRYSREKDIALAVAIKLGKMLADEVPDVEIVQT